MKKPYYVSPRPDNGIYFVVYATEPKKRISTGQRNEKDAKLWAEAHRKDRINTTQTLNEFAEGFFIPGRHKWFERKLSKNKTFGSDFRQVNQGRLDNYILPYFGSYLLPAIRSRTIDDWLIDLKGKYKPLSDATKNKILVTFRHVLQEAKEQDLIEFNPASEIEMIRENKKTRDIFTEDELKSLFPDSQEELLKVWLTKEWELFFKIEMCCGLRPGEVSALRWEDFYPDLHGFVIRHSIDSRTGEMKGIKTEKTGVKEKPAFVTKYIIDELQKLKDTKNSKDDDFIFPSIYGNTLKAETSNKHFKASCERAGIDRGDRTQYSLRHTFDTELLKELSRDNVQDLMGHTSYRKDYDHRTGKDKLAQLNPIIPIIEKRFSF